MKWKQQQQMHYNSYICLWWVLNQFHQIKSSVGILPGNTSISMKQVGRAAGDMVCIRLCTETHETHGGHRSVSENTAVK